ncbi:SpaH/EbpB family LPXTG-anchored major pilin [Holdemanella biformis]|uniref:Isopeptide-forming domain-containing fimbrial protein n=1 Tax=Holdemanella biformis TaxID=1735 RepID=A0A412J6B0_9FIRM|nr:SpaH/EbpB family LPXTG-anchored major pilin [Holdemanella biformis]RGS47887.1 isopeptide-forming domain-containing fimbrial protein [Holdemanella biformis]
MKRIKKLVAAMLTAIMMMTMTVTAYAAGSCTLTVTTKGGQDLKGQTINLYKLFDVTESKSGETTNYAYTVNDTYKGTLASVLNIQENSTNEKIVQAVTALGESNNAKVQKFANDFTAKALTSNLAVTKTSGKITEENKTSCEFTELDAGYYLVYVTGGKEIQSSLVTVDATTSKVELKTEGPSISKTADKTTVEIGQVVTYTVKGSIPDITGYDQYQYIIHDTLSKGLDFVNDANGTALGEGITNVNVTVAFTDADVTDKGTAPATATLDTANKRKMNLDLSAWVKANQANKGKAFTVTYYAKVNKDAEVTNNNKASLEYGNNPTDTTTTTPSEAKTNTYPLDINKIKTGTKEQLNGATFKLYRNSVESNNVVKVSAVAGKAGCYVVDSNSADTEMATVATNIDGKGYNLHINGLAAGTYYLEETKAPDGFNKLTDPIKVTITKTGDTEWTVSKGEDVETDKIIDVENSTGSLLPSTGGAGVIVFAGVAILLVFGVVVSFIRDKRKAC